MFSRSICAMCNILHIVSDIGLILKNAHHMRTARHCRCSDRPARPSGGLKVWHAYQLDLLIPTERFSLAIVMITPMWIYTCSSGPITIDSSGFVKTGELILRAEVKEIVTCCTLIPGYGLCRPWIQMFDPSWKSPRSRGPEDAGTLDGGGDPVGMMQK